MTSPAPTRARWLPSRWPADAAGRKNMVLLVHLRWIAIAGQVATILLVHFGMGIRLPILPMLVVPCIAAARSFDRSESTSTRAAASIIPVPANTSVTPKISIPGPSAIHFRIAEDDIHVAEYKHDAEAYFDAITATYKKAVEAFYAAGCRYLQMDDIFFAYLCDPKIREQRKAKGEDPDWLIGRYAKMMHDAIVDRPADMLIGMHMCRGNFKSTWVAEGAYDPAADAIFNQTGVDIYFMEYDTDRAGGLEPLRLLPKGKKRVMPGFITTKTGELESLDSLRRKFDEASKYADLDQLGIAPQCGFSSTEEGNAITMDDQKRKLELVVKTAEAVWGGVDK